MEGIRPGGADRESRELKPASMTKAVTQPFNCHCQVERNAEQGMYMT